jgi:hypothetical protein
LERLFYLFLLGLFFLLLEVPAQFILGGSLDELDFRVVSIQNVLLVISLTVENAVDVLQHFL